MDTLEAAATCAVAGLSSSSLDRGAVAGAPSDELQVGRWPGWARLTVVLGGSAALWAAIIWAVTLVLKLG
jgi:hypothetical protein